MRIKTIVLIVAVILITVIIMQNNERVYFKVLFGSVATSKMFMMAIMAVAGFIIGFMVGRPRKAKIQDTYYRDTEDEGKEPGTLSDEDREYIS